MLSKFLCCSFTSSRWKHVKIYQHFIGFFISRQPAKIWIRKKIIIFYCIIKSVKSIQKKKFTSSKPFTTVLLIIFDLDGHLCIVDITTNKVEEIRVLLFISSTPPSMCTYISFCSSTMDWTSSLLTCSTSASVKALDGSIVISSSSFSSVVVDIFVRM